MRTIKKTFHDRLLSLPLVKVILPREPILFYSWPQRGTNRSTQKDLRRGGLMILFRAVLEIQKSPEQLIFGV
jgi:hypothetical protein